MHQREKSRLLWWTCLAAMTAHTEGFCPPSTMKLLRVIQPARSEMRNPTISAISCERRSHGAAPSRTESDLRQTAIDEYFASCHKAAVIGGEEQGCGSRFVRVAHTFKWCLAGKIGKKRFLHSRFRQSIEKTWRRCSARGEHIDPDACTLQVQRPASCKIPDSGLCRAVHAEGGRSHGACS